MNIKYMHDRTVHPIGEEMEKFGKASIRWKRDVGFRADKIAEQVV
jgi:hypothetical protein